MTETATEFTVTADAERHIRAERATVIAHISSRSLTSKSEAHNAVAEVHNRMAAQARAFRSSGAATWHHATAPSSYSIKESWKPDKDSEPRDRTVFVTASKVEVKFQNFEAMSDWLAELADEPLVQTSQPLWALTEQTQKETESKVRTLAVRNARQYANDYAAGEDIEPSALRLSKVDASVSARGGYPMAGATRGSAGSSNTAFAVTPNEVTVSASVTATFVATVV